jgi:hypothetical protein
MKLCFLCLSLFLAISTIRAQLKFPSPSPEQMIHQDFGLSSIDISYSRPSVKGRKIFGDLVPYDKAWRTGANGPTTITFGDEVIIGGKTISPGKYGFIAIPGKTSWTLVITKQLDIVSSADYKQENDVVRVSCKPVTLPKKIETFSMQFENFTASSCELSLTWEKTAVALPIKADLDKKVMEGIDKAMSENDPPYFQAAYYYFSNNKDLHKAEEWAKKATGKDPDAYYMFYLLAQIQAKLGEKENAIASANKSIELSKQNKRDDYIDLNNNLIKSLK